MTDSIEVPLKGGNTSDVVRVADTVRRPVRPWTESVHLLLDHLAERGLKGVPRQYGIDDRDREVLDFLPGDTASGTPWDDRFWSDKLLVDAGVWLRRFHEAVADFRPPPSARWFTGRGAPAFGQIVCHNDIAPYNTVIDRRGRLSGIIDWDTAAPAVPEWDLAGAAWQWVPLHHPTITSAIGGPPESEQARRLRILCDAYGYLKPAELLMRVRARVDTMLSALSARDVDDHPVLSRLRSGGHEHLHARTATYLDARVPVLAHALRNG